MSQYNEWNFGVSYGTGLPRSWEDFRAGAFGPLTPLQPMGIDSPQTESGRPEPRRMQYPVGWNMPMGQPGSEGLKLVSFANLRAYADMYSVVRACIQVRKEEILGLDWDIVPTDEGAREMRGDVTAHEDFQDRRRKALKFFKRPDPNYHDFSGWLSAVLEDVFVVDALSLYLHPSRVKGRGLLGSDLAALEVLDGTTIRPLLDVRGGTPRPPSPGYQQYLWGVPRTDMMDIILEADIEEMDEPVDEYRADQLLYLPYTRRSWTPYGFPGIERAIIPVMTGLRRQQFQLDYFSEGSIPGQFIIPGDDISTPQQIRQLQDTLNAIAGDQAWKHKVIVLPRGSSAQLQKPVELAGQIDEILLNMICMAYDVMPMELGMSPSTSASQSSGAASQMAKASQEINQRKALKPMLQWLKTAIFDHILQDVCHQEDMQFVWIGLQDAHDEEAQATNFKTLISTGLLSIDEARSQMGLNPWGLPLTSDPVYASATGISTLGTIAVNIADAELGDVIADPSTLATQPGTPQPVQLGSAAPDAAVASTTQAPATTTGTPGIGGRPRGGGGGAPAIIAPAAGTSTPLHGSNAKNKQKNDNKATQKAASIEFDSLRRFLKKGKSIDKWTPEFITAEAFSAVKKSIGRGNELGIAINNGRSVMKSATRLPRRKEVIDGVSGQVVSTLGALAADISNPRVGMIGFIDQGTRALQHGYHAVYHAAAKDASRMHTNVSHVVPKDFKELAARRAESQRGFITGLAKDVISGISTPKLNQRLALYARTLQPTYEEGFGLAVLSGQAIGNATYDDTSANDTPVDDTSVDDVSTPDASVDDTSMDEPDALSSYNDLSSMYADNSETPDEDSGDGSGDGMSSLLFLAGMVGIGLLDSAIGADQTDSEGAQIEDDGGDFAQSPRSTIIWHATSEEPCDLCDERDGEEYTLETLPCWPGDGGFGEFCDGAANCKCYLEYVEPDNNTTSDNPFSDFSGTFYQQRAAEENAYDQAAIDARAADIASVALESPDAAARMEARDTLYGVSGTRYGAGGRYDINASASPSLTKSNEELLNDTVYEYLKAHYKKSVVKWAKNATWTFSPKLSLDELILMRKPSMVSQEKVAKIESAIRHGDALHPIVVVKTSAGYEVADGNHRVTAMRNVGIETTTAYVTSGIGDTGPWTTEMQNDSMKKFSSVEITKDVNEDFTPAVAYKAIDPTIVSILQVGDIISDDDVVPFTFTRPAAETVAIIKNLPTGRLVPGQELIVVDVSASEIVLEIL